MRNKLGKPGKGRSVTPTLEEWTGPCFIKKKRPDLSPFLLNIVSCIILVYQVMFVELVLGCIVLMLQYLLSHLIYIGMF